MSDVAASAPAEQTLSTGASSVKSDEMTAIPQTDKTVDEISAVQPERKAGDALKSETAAPTTPVTNAVPITSGVLAYKAPGFMKLTFKKQYFWLGDEPVPTQNMSLYLRGEKPDISHSVTAWSNHTGKGLLYFVKEEIHKATPQHAFNLADVTDLEKISWLEFSFKLHKEKHTFKAAEPIERDGWFMAIERAIPEAKASREDIMSGDTYKESMAQLARSSFLAGGVAAGTAGVAKAAEHKEDKPVEAKKSTDLDNAERTVRAGSSSSGDHVGLAVRNNKSKSRSVSRGKRNSIFGSLLGKKEEHDAKKEVKKEDKAEGLTTEGGIAATAAPLDAAVIADRVLGAPVDDAAAPLEDSTISAVPAAETTDLDATKEAALPPKPSKRNSIFGSIYQMVRSPQQEKSESEVGPIVPPKDAVEVPTTAAEPTLESAEVSTTVPERTLPVNDIAAAKAETPAGVISHKEKSSFLGNLMNKARAKSPAAERRRASVTADAPAVPSKDDEVAEEAALPAATPVEASATTSEATSAMAMDETDKSAAILPETAGKTTTAATKENRRKSLFGSLGAKKEKTEGETMESETPLNKFTHFLRRPSQAGRTKETKTENAPLVPTIVEPTSQKLETPTPSSINPIGDEQMKSGPESITAGHTNNVVLASA